jgi:hypothetical protein
MIGVLTVLRAAARGAPHFAWLDEARRARARAAVARGVDCLLRLQVEINGVRTGWGQQHDAKTLAPAARGPLSRPASRRPTRWRWCVSLWARTGPPELIARLDAAVAWLGQVRLNGHQGDAGGGAAGGVFPSPDGFRCRGGGGSRGPAALAAHGGARHQPRAVLGPRRRDQSTRWPNRSRAPHRVGLVRLLAAPLRLLENDYPAWRAKQGK